MLKRASRPRCHDGAFGQDCRISSYEPKLRLLHTSMVDASNAGAALPLEQSTGHVVASQRMAGDGFGKQYGAPGYSVPTVDIGQAFDAGVGNQKQLY